MVEMAYVTREEFQEMKRELGELEETIEVIMDRELMASIKRGKKDIEEGKIISHEEIKKKYLR